MYLMKRKGSPYYQIYYFENGKKKAVSTKETRKAEALRFLSNFEANLKKKPELNEISLECFKTEYLQYIKIKYSKSHYEKNYITFKYLLEQTGNIPIGKLTFGQVENFILQWYNEKSKYTASNYFRNLRASLNYALEHKYISENFLSRFKFPKLPQPIPQFIDETQLKTILAEVSEEILQDMYTMYFHTGTRLNELIHLQWQDVDLQNGIIRIVNRDNFTIKTKHERIIPLNNVSSEILKKRLPKVIDINGYVFSRAGIKYNGDYISKKFKAACRDAGFQDLHLHQLRHSFCSNLIKKNVPVRVVMELAGHQSLAVTQKYMHVKQEQLFDAVRLLAHD